jgi:hypothetical protein
LRILISAAAAVLAAVALAGATSAADDTPFLVVTSWDNAPGKVDETEIDLSVRATGAAPAKLTILVPVGYGVDTAPAAGAKVGDVAASISAAALGSSPTNVQGTVVADDPAKHATDACAPGTHAAVWVATLSAGGQSIAIPIYVDAAVGTQASTAAYVLQACLASPDVPDTSGGAPLGARLLEVDFDFAKTFTLPAGAKTHAWSALVTPFLQGQTTADAAATYLLRAAVPAPHVLRLATKYDKKTHTATISGRVTAAGAPRPGIRVHVLAGPKPSFASLKAYVTVTTDKTGAFSFKRKLTKTTYLWAYVNPYFTSSCATTADAPGGCANGSISGALGNTASIVVKK